MGKVFRWLLMAAAAGGMRWAQLKTRIGHAFRAGATTAPTVDGGMADTGGYGVGADPIKVPISDGQVRQGEATETLAQGDTRRIVLARMWAGLYGAFRAVGATIPTVAAAFREIWAAAHRAAAESVPTTPGDPVPAAQAIAPRMEPEAVETVLPASTSTTGAALIAAPSAAETAQAGAGWQPAARFYAQPRTWYEPVVVGGVLYLRQAVEVTAKNGILEVR